MDETNCIFCKIVGGEAPSHKIYEDDSFLAFLDIRPQAPGQTLIIPKVHHRWVWDIKEAGPYFEVVSRVARAMQQAFGTDEVHARVIGEEVPHAHVVVYPAPSKNLENKSDIEGNAEKLRRALI